MPTAHSLAVHIFYLHGFASSAQSSKARFFADRLARHGIALHCPDFNEPDDAVDPQVTERFARARSNRTIHMLNDGHQLLGNLEFIWRETARALGL